MPEMKTWTANGVTYDIRDQNSVNHIANRSNPHGVTAGQIGAAPAGYGLGEDISGAIDLDTVTKSGNYKGNVKLPGYTTGAIVWCRADMSSANYGTQHIYTELNGGGELFRTKDNGVWSEWEWGNPPMVPGVEYRTTKRCNGKVVYTKRVSFATLPNTGAASVNISGMVKLISAIGTIIETATGYDYVLPHFGYSNGITAATIMHRNGTKLYIKTYADMTGFTGEVTVEYTKD